VSDLTEKVRRLAQPALAASGLSLVDVEILGQGRKLLVRAVVDQPGGVGVEDCARLSRQLGDILEVHDLIDRPYILEVSSPGLDRALKKPSDFAWAVGKPIRLTVHQPREGQNVFSGLLTAFEDEVLTLDTGSASLKLPLSEVARARLNIDPFRRD